MSELQYKHMVHEAQILWLQFVEILWWGTRGNVANFKVKEESLKITY